MTPSTVRWQSSTIRSRLSFDVADLLIVHVIDDAHLLSVNVFLTPL